MKFSRFAAASVLTLSLGAATMALTQSGSSPSGSAATAKKPAVAAAPKLIALSFYADWCPGCRELKPKLDKVMSANHDAPCLFVKLDQTDKESQQAEFLLASLGMGELWKEHAGRTGYALVIEPKSKRVVATLQATQTEEAMNNALKTALGR